MPTEELESEKRSTAAPTSKPVRRLAGLRKIGAAFAWLAGVGAILGGLTGYWSTYRTVTTELLPPAASKPMASRFSIAVLPFANLGGEGRNRRPLGKSHRLEGDRRRRPANRTRAAK